MKEKFVRFMVSVQGRLARIGLGIVIFIVGKFFVQGAPGTIMTLLAIIPFAGGLFDFCLIAGLLGYPLRGPKVRQMLASR